MENGLPSNAKLVVNRDGGSVYDLVAHHEVNVEKSSRRIRIPVRLGPCDGRVFMITDRAIAQVEIVDMDDPGDGAGLRPHRHPLHAHIGLAPRVARTALKRRPTRR